MNIFNIFKKKNTTFDITAFTEKWPVGSWYKSGNNQVIRLSNVYVKAEAPLISVEYPILDPVKNTFRMSGEDDLSPAYLNGRTKVTGPEADKLEKSYWKTIEKDLEKRTKVAKDNYQKFLDFGKKP